MFSLLPTVIIVLAIFFIGVLIRLVPFLVLRTPRLASLLFLILLFVGVRYLWVFRHDIIQFFQSLVA
ncbi:MAG: hypothetical protein M3O22_01065 [Pseudomonadota bacterium]|nr:hypothetical protein [Pseudomonadota bacterium]